MKPMTSVPQLFPGERSAVETVIALGEQYGYGNLIGHLKRAWALRLMKGNPNLTYKDALRATNVSGYSKDFDISKLG